MELFLQPKHLLEEGPLTDDPSNDWVPAFEGLEEGPAAAQPSLSLNELLVDGRKTKCWGEPPDCATSGWYPV